MEQEDPARPVTMGDLTSLKIELLREMRKMVVSQPAPLQKKYLKSHEVRKLLKISHGTLQHLRDSGQLKFSKVGGIMFYDIKEIEKMME